MISEKMYVAGKEKTMSKKKEAAGSGHSTAAKGNKPINIIFSFIENVNKEESII